MWNHLEAKSVSCLDAEQLAGPRTARPRRARAYQAQTSHGPGHFSRPNFENSAIVTVLPFVPWSVFALRPQPLFLWGFGYNFTNYNFRNSMFCFETPRVVQLQSNPHVSFSGPPARSVATARPSARGRSAVSSTRTAGLSTGQFSENSVWRQTIYIYIYIYIHIYICVYTYVCTYMCIYIYIYMYICTSISPSLSIYIYI